MGPRHTTSLRMICCRVPFSSARLVEHISIGLDGELSPTVRHSRLLASARTLIGLDGHRHRRPYRGGFHTNILRSFGEILVEPDGAS